MARRIGTALGVSWQVVLSDFSESTYSSARIDRIEAEAAWAPIRQDLVELLRWVRLEALTDAWLRGDADLAGLDETAFAACTALPPAKPWVDPVAEVQAAVAELNMGLTTLRDLAASRGRDWDDLLRQRIAERKLKKELEEEAGLEPETSEGELIPPPPPEPAPKPAAKTKPRSSSSARSARSFAGALS